MPTDTEVLQQFATALPIDDMTKFNAIRNRVNTVQQPSQLPLSANEGEKKMQFEAVNPNTGETLATIYSTGEPQTKEQFTAAMNTYNAKGKVNGFTVLEPGVVNTIRSTFESAVGNPMRAAANTIRQSPDMPSTSPYIPDVIQSPVAAVANKLKQVAAGIPQGLSTPEGAGATAGTIAAAMGSSGLSLPLQVGATALGAGSGSVLGDLATGSNQGNLSATFGQATSTALTAAAFQGGAAVLKVALGMGMSQRAQQQVAEDLMTTIKDKFRPLVNDPQAIDAMMSTPAGVRDIVQIGVKGLRNSAEDTSQSFIVDLQTQLPRSLKGETAKEMKSVIQQLVKKQNSYLDNIDNTKLTTSIIKDMDSLGQQVTSLIRKEFAGLTKVEDQVLKGTMLLKDFWQSTSDFVGTANVLSALKKSGADRGFNVSNFQREIQPYFRDPAQGDMMKGAANAAYRGGSGESVDEAVRVGLPLSKIPLINKIPGIGDTFFGKNIGQSYVGKVRSTYPVSSAAATSTAQQGSTDAKQQSSTIKSIKEYLGEK